jgi:hypothetical protein
MHCIAEQYLLTPLKNCVLYSRGMKKVEENVWELIIILYPEIGAKLLSWEGDKN